MKKTIIASLIALLVGGASVGSYHEAKLETIQEEHKLEAANMEKENQNLREERNVLKDETNTLKDRIVNYQETITDLKTEKENQSDKINRALREIDQLKEENSKLKKAKANLRKEEVVAVKKPAEKVSKTKESPTKKPEVKKPIAKKPVIPETEKIPKEKAAKLEANSGWQTFSASAYSTYANGDNNASKKYGGTTASGTQVSAGRTIAVDPNIIPLGTVVNIKSDFPGISGQYVAEDTGSAIKGNRIDIYMSNLDTAINFGRRTIQVQW